MTKSPIGIGPGDNFDSQTQLVFQVTFHPLKTRLFQSADKQANAGNRFILYISRNKPHFTNTEFSHQGFFLCPQQTYDSSVSFHSLSYTPFDPSPLDGKTFLRGLAT